MSFVHDDKDFDALLRIVADTLPALVDYASPRELADDMVGERQIKPVRAPDHPAFAIANDERGEAIRSAFQAIGPMFWAPRKTLGECTEQIRAWLESSGVRPCA